MFKKHKKLIELFDLNEKEKQRQSQSLKNMKKILQTLKGFIKSTVENSQKQFKSIQNSVNLIKKETKNKNLKHKSSKSVNAFQITYSGNNDASQALEVEIINLKQKIQSFQNDNNSLKSVNNLLLGKLKNEENKSKTLEKELDNLKLSNTSFADETECKINKSKQIHVENEIKSQSNYQENDGRPKHISSDIISHSKILENDVRRKPVNKTIIFGDNLHQNSRQILGNNESNSKTTQREKNASVIKFKTDESNIDNENNKVNQHKNSQTNFSNSRNNKTNEVQQEIYLTKFKHEEILEKTILELKQKYFQEIQTIKNEFELKMHEIINPP